MIILIVDDRAEDRRLLRCIAEHHGYQVLEAAHGAEALVMAEKHRPDLIISDALMPDMDGFQFLRQVKGDEKLRDIPFIVYSAAYLRHDDMQLALNLGAASYIVKPKAPLELWAEVERSMRSDHNKVVTQSSLKEEDYLRQYSQSVVAQLAQKIEELEASESLYRSLVNTMADGVILFSADGAINTFNAAACKILGRSAAEISGWSCERFAEVTVHGDESPFLSTEHPIIHTLQSGHPQSNVEMGIKKYDGRRAWISVNTRSLASNIESNPPHAVIATFHDITARKKAQAALEQKAAELANANLAMKVILNHNREAEQELKEKMVANIEGLVLPYLNQLDGYLKRDDARQCLDVARRTIKECASSFSKDMAASVLGLTPREVQIADLVRRGITNKEIAAQLNLSVGTVSFYRDSIRDKLGIKNRKINLRTYLVSSFKE